MKEEQDSSGDVASLPDPVKDSRPAAAESLEEFDETDGFIDLDSVKLLDEDFQIISHIRKLSDTTRDKLVFTIFTVNIMMTGFLAGYTPQYFYIFYSIKAVLLLSYRWYSYKKMKYHYFLFDFCYFTSLLTLLYLWLPWGHSFRGTLFPTIFGFSHGPLLAAVALWKNSIVLHSVDKMTSIFIHISPAITLWGIRWFSTNEQGFPLCAEPVGPGPTGCDHIDTQELLLYPMLMYFLWQICYILVVFLWRKEKIEKKNYETSYKWMVTKSKKSFVYQMCSVLGPRYTKHLYITCQFIYTTCSMLLAYPCYHYNSANMALMIVVLTVASYNGASFYIDVFSRRYVTDSSTKHKNT